MYINAYEASLRMRLAITGRFVHNLFSVLWCLFLNLDDFNLLLSSSKNITVGYASSIITCSNPTTAFMVVFIMADGTRQVIFMLFSVVGLIYRKKSESKLVETHFIRAEILLHCSTLRPADLECYYVLSCKLKVHFQIKMNRKWIEIGIHI